MQTDNPNLANQQMELITYHPWPRLTKHKKKMKPGNLQKLKKRFSMCYHIHTFPDIVKKRQTIKISRGSYSMLWYGGNRPHITDFFNRELFSSLSPPVVREKNIHENTKNFA